MVERYLGLFAGMTISVSIPAAIMSMAMLYPFGGNILEINAVSKKKREEI